MRLRGRVGRWSAHPPFGEQGSAMIGSGPSDAAAAREVAGWTWRPPAAIAAHAFRWAGALFVLFVVVYGGLNWLTARRADRLQLWFDWELAIPLVPWMVWVYLSLVATFFLPMFVLDVPRINALCRRLAFATVVSGLCFVLFPAELGFVRLDAVPEYKRTFALIHALDLPHNLAPSLHVSWSLVLLLTLSRASSGWLRAGFHVWLGLLLASVVLTHQHHVLDVAGGVLVALTARAVVASDGRTPRGEVHDSASSTRSDAAAGVHPRPGSRSVTVRR